MNGTKRPSRDSEDRPLVSIITPSYNQADFIEENILSVMTQDYPNIEHIVIDGCSTDNTLEVLNKYNDKITWISEKDNCPEEAINKGFRMATGEIMGGLNSDDYYLPGGVSKAVEFLTSRPDIDMVYCRAEYVDERGAHLGEYPTEPFDYKRLAILDYICQPAVFFTREVFEETKGYSEILKFATDYELWLRVAQKFNIEYLDEMTSAYRIHGEARNVLDENSFEIAQEILDTVMRYFHRAPANRVFASSYHRVLSSLPREASPNRALTLFKTFFLALKEYLRLNKTIHIEDLKLITPDNIKKMMRGWEIKDWMK